MPANFVSRATLRPGVRCGGFTLLETLVAATILFAVIATMTALYQGALTASYKAEAAVDRAAVTPYILDTIRFQIREEGKREGYGELQGVEYSWQAQLDKQATAYVPDVISNEYRLEPDRFKLWSVSLQIGNQPVLNFKEISW